MIQFKSDKCYRVKEGTERNLISCIEKEVYYYNFYPNLPLFFIVFKFFIINLKKAVEKMIWGISKFCSQFKSLCPGLTYFRVEITQSTYFLFFLEKSLKPHWQLVPHFLTPWPCRPCSLPSWYFPPTLDNSWSLICFLWSLIHWQR